MLESALRTHALGDTNISGKIGTRLYPVILPQDVVYPASTYMRVSGPRTRTYDGPDGLENPRIQFDHYADTYKEAKELADLFRQRFDGFQGTVSGTRIQSVALENDTDIYEDPIEKHRVMQDFMIWSEE